MDSISTGKLCYVTHIVGIFTGTVFVGLTASNLYNSLLYLPFTGFLFVYILSITGSSLVDKYPLPALVITFIPTIFVSYESSYYANPLWSCVAIFVTITTSVIIANYAVCRITEENITDYPVCCYCSYNLRENYSDKCPECGNPVKARIFEKPIESANNLQPQIKINLIWIVLSSLICPLLFGIFAVL